MEFVSNNEKNIYAIHGLPEEIIAMIFAYVSRSPLSFREHLSKATKEGATLFHKKWVIDYGHSSIAEQAVLHFGLENVSRLFSGILETSSPHASFLEYSQRYQQVPPGHYHVPSNLVDVDLKTKYVEYQNKIYDIYYKILVSLDKEKKGTIASGRHSVNALEEARYMLTLATYTQLGMTVNGRALASMLRKMFSNPIAEVRENAVALKQEGTLLMPTLLRHSEPTTFLLENSFFSEECFEHPFIKENGFIPFGNFVFWLKEDGQMFSEMSILKKLLGISHVISNQGLDVSTLSKLFKKKMSSMSCKDDPPEIFKVVRFEFGLIMSEACWHQWLRHRFLNSFVIKTSWHGKRHCLPSLIEHDRVAKVLAQEAMELSVDMMDKLKKEDEALASYAILNCAEKHVMVSFSLWDMYKLLFLRSTVQTQQEIKNIVMTMGNAISSVYPNVMEHVNHLISIN